MQLEPLLQTSMKHHASDLHLSPGHRPVLRIEGDLRPMAEYPALSAESTTRLIQESLSAIQFRQLETERELDYAMQLPDRTRFRVNAYHGVQGMAAAFRVIPSTLPTLDALRLPAVFKKLLRLSSGLILVTGATGSGKSTTLAAMINEINTHDPLHIVTLEDPIEFMHPVKKGLMTQREIHRDTLSFNTALRSVLRQDPDIILVGELRDLETIRLALTAAETGHLVMATLHTSSAPRTINRMVDVFPLAEKQLIRNLLSGSLQAVICQTLVRAKTGGRVAAFEILLVNDAIRHLIREDKMAQMVSVMQTGAATGMCTMPQYLQNLVAKQEIDATIANEWSA